MYTKRNGLVGSSFNWKGVDVHDLLNKERRFGSVGYVAKTYEEAVIELKKISDRLLEVSNWVSTNKFKVEPVSEDMISVKLTLVLYWDKETLQESRKYWLNNPYLIYKMSLMDKKTRKKFKREYKKGFNFTRGEENGNSKTYNFNGRREVCVETYIK